MGDTRHSMADTSIEIPAGPWLPVSTSKPAASTMSPTAGAAPEGWQVEFRVDLGFLPYLTDHGFHDMVVLPGSFHIELVRSIHRDLFHREASSLRHIAFERPVIVADDVVITVRAERHDGGQVAYTLFEMT